MSWLFILKSSFLNLFHIFATIMCRRWEQGILYRSYFKWCMFFSALNQASLSIKETHNIFLFRIKPTFLSRREYIARIIAVDIALNVRGSYPLFEVKGFRGFKQLIRSSWVFTVFFSKCILTRATQFEYKHSYIFQIHLLPQTTPLPESSVSPTNVVKFLKSLLKHNIQL